MLNFGVFKFFSRIKLFIFFILAVIFIISNGLAQETDYTLFCRGGGNTEIMINLLSYAFGGSYIYIRMQGANTAAKERMPDPGYCAWFDRGFRQDELTSNLDPWRRIWKKSLESYIVLESSENISPMMFDLVAVDSNKRVNLRFSASILNYLINSIFQGQVFQIKVKRKYGNVFEITHIGPFMEQKPSEVLKKGQPSPSLPEKAQRVVESSLPDLAITKVQEKEECKFEITIKNLGAPLQDTFYQSNPELLSIKEAHPMGRFLAKFNLNEVDSQRSLKSSNGETKFIWIIPKTIHSIDKDVIFFVDPEKKIIEANEQNNAYNLHIVCPKQSRSDEKKAPLNIIPKK